MGVLIAIVCVYIAGKSNETHLHPLPRRVCTSKDRRLILSVLMAVMDSVQTRCRSNPIQF